MIPPLSTLAAFRAKITVGHFSHRSHRRSPTSQLMAMLAMGPRIKQRPIINNPKASNDSSLFKHPPDLAVVKLTSKVACSNCTSFQQKFAD
jgi:hypothetical protein